MPVRIYDISKKLGLEVKEILAKAKQMGIAAAKVPSSSLDKISAEWLEEELLKNHPNLLAKLAPPPLEEKTVVKPIEEKIVIINANLTEKKGRITRKLVIPVCNCKQPPMVVSPLSFPDNLSLDQIADEDYATLHREQPDVFIPITTPKSQCFTTELKEAYEAEAVASEAIAKVQFVFKTLSAIPLVLSHAAVVISQPDKKATIEKVLPFPIWGDYSKQTDLFAFKEGVKPDEVIKFYEVINTAVSKHPAFSITLSRFNSCWLRSTEHDKIIDIAISLESLLSSSTEINFKFALFNSFIARKIPTEREEAFQLFKLLYNARSKIVHGDIKKHAKDIGKVIELLPKIRELAHAAISYYAFFLYYKDPNEWQEHLDKLVFGTTTLIDLNQNSKNENKEAK
jgi:Translation initiation factor IF-2, N-terminal region